MGVDFNMDNPFALLGSIAIGALIFIVILMFAPLIGGTVDEAMPALCSTSEWNPDHNTDLPNMSETWVTIAALLILCAIIGIIAFALTTLRRMGE